MHWQQRDGHALTGADRHSGSPDDEDQGNPDGVRGRTVHGSEIHRDVENSRSGLVLGAHGSGRNSNRGREIHVDAESEKASTGTLSMPLTETPDIAFSGEVTTGSYSPLTLTGTATESYTGGATCGEKVGKTAVKAVKKGTFTGSAVSFE